jgi:hypothetical protein
VCVLVVRGCDRCVFRPTGPQNIFWLMSQGFTVFPTVAIECVFNVRFKFYGLIHLFAWPRLIPELDGK